MGIAKRILLLMFVMQMIFLAIAKESLDPNIHDGLFECGDQGNRHVGTFTLYDYSIVLGMLVISLGIGVFYGFFSGTENTSADFLHGTEMSLLPVSLSLTTSFITAIELLGNPSEMVFNGTQFALIALSIFAVIPGTKISIFITPFFLIFTTLYTKKHNVHFQWLSKSTIQYILNYN